MVQPPACIRAVAICIIRRDDEVLVFEGFDAKGGYRYFRPLGGGIEPGERAMDAVARELREELNSGLLNIRQRGLIENLFEFEGRACHEHVFVFEADLAERSLYDHDVVEAAQDNGAPLRAIWRRIDAFDSGNRLVPPELMPFLDPTFEPTYVRRTSSASVEQHLELADGRRLPVAQAASKFIVLREAHTCEPCDAVLVVSVDGRATQTPIHLPAGLDASRAQQPIVERADVTRDRH